MKTFEQFLNEGVSRVKYDKMLEKLKGNQVLFDQLKGCDSDEKLMEFAKEVYGDPKGLYKNTIDEQMGVLKKIRQSILHKNGGKHGAYFRPVFGEIG